MEHGLAPEFDTSSNQETQHPKPQLTATKQQTLPEATFRLNSHFKSQIHSIRLTHNPFQCKGRKFGNRFHQIEGGDRIGNN